MPAPASAKLSAAVDDAQRGLLIRRNVAFVLRTYAPVLVAQEGNAGSQSASAAAALARAQQACVDAIDVHLGAMPIFRTGQAVKKAAVGRHTDVTKEDMEKAARRLWPGTDWERMLRDDSITGRTPPGKWENAYDAACVAWSVWDDPSVSLLRKL